jgi:hypothetical protein
MMQSDLVVYLVAGFLLILLFLLPCWFWHRGQTRPAATKPPRTTREPKPFAGLTHKPECELCEQGVASQLQRPSAPPPPMKFTLPVTHNFYFGGSWGMLRTFRSL